jgi:hypothetical protein
MNQYREQSFIKAHFTDDYGRGHPLDIITLKDGTVLVISDEYIGHYSSLDDFDGGSDELNGFKREASK